MAGYGVENGRPAMENGLGSPELPRAQPRDHAMWLVEGLILYGLLSGYTMYYRARQRGFHRRVEEQPFVPAVVA